MSAAAALPPKPMPRARTPRGAVGFIGRLRLENRWDVTPATKVASTAAFKWPAGGSSAAARRAQGLVLTLRARGPAPAFGRSASRHQLTAIDLDDLADDVAA